MRRRSESVSHQPAEPPTRSFMTNCCWFIAYKLHLPSSSSLYSSRGAAVLSVCVCLVQQVQVQVSLTLQHLDSHFGHPVGLLLVQTQNLGQNHLTEAAFTQRLPQNQPAEPQQQDWVSMKEEEEKRRGRKRRKSRRRNWKRRWKKS